MSNVDCCGIDIAKSKFDCAIRPGDGKYKDKVFKNDISGFVSFISWITGQIPGTPHVCIEATGIYREAFAEYLIHREFTVSVVNPAQIKHSVCPCWSETKQIAAMPVL
ncbi:IS110 family transposase [Salmonella enterica]|nr:IS110 family transposase [Salmonella enterica]